MQAILRVLLLCCVLVVFGLLISFLDNTIVIQYPPITPQLQVIDMDVLSHGASFKSAADRSHNSSNHTPSTNVNRHDNASVNRNGKSLKILLVTNYRSGSSFVGELLNTNPYIFYSFEPLYVVAGKRHRKAVYQNLTSYLEDLLFKCDVKVLQQDSPLYRTQRVIRFWIRLMFPGCKQFELVNKKCQEKPNTAAKVIRIPLLESVVPSLTDKGSIILYLVRDPRGIMSSRLKLKGNKFKMDKWRSNIERLCTSFERNAKFIRNNTEDGQFKYKDNVIILRYEDIALRPLEMTAKLYKYLGTELPERVKQFIENSTKETAVRKNPYGVQRNSKKTAEAWRDHLPLDFVNGIEKQCADAMTDYGYAPMSRATLHDEEYKTVLPFPDDLPHL